MADVKERGSLAVRLSRNLKGKRLNYRSFKPGQVHISNGNPIIFVNHPLAIILLVITVALLLPGFIGRSAKRKGAGNATALTDELKE